MYDSTKYPKVFFSVSQRTYNQKPTDKQIADEIHFHKFGGKYNVKRANLLDLKNYIEKLHVIFPTNTYEGETLIDPMNLLFFDFDNKGAKIFSREVLIIKLKKMNMCPNLVYTTYNSTKDQNRFRLVYVLSQILYSRSEAEDIQRIMFEILEPYGVDTNARITNIFFGGYDAEILNTKPYNISLLKAIHTRAKRSKKVDCQSKSENLMLPTANGFAYALNLVDDELYKKSKNGAKVVLRLLKKDTSPVDMDFDDDIADVNLHVLKAVYSMHCRKETTCIDNEKHLYSVDISLIVTKTGINFYERKMHRLKEMLNDYNRLVACIGENELLTVFRNKIEESSIIYSGKYFDWLKGWLFENIDSTIPKQHTHNHMLKYETLVGGNMYAELIAEQVLRSVLRCGAIQKYRGISLKTLIAKTPQLRHKYESIKTANEKNIFLGRVLKYTEIILSEKSSFKQKYAGRDFILPTVSSKHLDRQITVTANEAARINDFLEDFSEYTSPYTETTSNDYD